MQSVVCRVQSAECRLQIADVRTVRYGPVEGISNSIPTCYREERKKEKKEKGSPFAGGWRSCGARRRDTEAEERIGDGDGGSGGGGGGGLASKKWKWLESLGSWSLFGTPLANYLD